MRQLMAMFTVSTAMFTAMGQTTVSLRTQSRDVDFSNAGATKPFKTQSALPSTCSTGEAFYLTTVASGKNLYLCTSPNNWTQFGAGAGAATDLMDCKVTLNGSAATVAAPCRLRMGVSLHSLSADAVATLSGTSASGVAYFYWDESGNLTAAESTSATLSCNAGCTVATQANFPIGSTPIATANFTNNVFNAVTDLRTVYSSRNVSCGTGLVCSSNSSNGETTVQADTVTQLLTKGALQSGQVIRCVSAATGSAHTCSFTPALNGYNTGMVVEFVPSAASISGASTVDISSLGAKAIKQADGVSDPDTNQVAAGQQVPLRFDGTVFRLPAAGLQTGTAAALPSCGAAQSGKAYVFTDSLYTLARCSGAAWSYYSDGRQVSPPAGAWTWDNQTQGGSASLDTSRAFHQLLVPSSHTTGYAVRYQTAPGGNYSRTFAIRLRAMLGANYVGYMVGFRDASGKLQGLNISYDSAASSAGFLLDVRRQATAATVTAAGFDFARTLLAALPAQLYIRISDDGTNISFAYSVDGYDFQTLYTGSRTAYLSSPANIFFGASAAGAASGAALDVISIQ